jgi:hypothetical protein
MEDEGIFYGHLVYFTVFCYILWRYKWHSWHNGINGIVRGFLVYSFPFWYFVPRKIWQPCFSGLAKLARDARNKIQPLPPDLIARVPKPGKCLFSPYFNGSFYCRGRCYDHNFSAIFGNFRRKNWRFS